MPIMKTPLQLLMLGVTLSAAAMDDGFAPYGAVARRCFRAPVPRHVRKPDHEKTVTYTGMAFLSREPRIYDILSAFVN